MSAADPASPVDPAAYDISRTIRLFAPLAASPREIVACAYFDPQWRICGLRHHPSPTRDTVTVAVRQMIRDALIHDARYLILAHNHPSGDPTPSRDDIAFTVRFARTLDAIGMTLADHLVVSAGATTSFRQAGLL